MRAKQLNNYKKSDIKDILENFLNGQRFGFLEDCMRLSESDDVHFDEIASDIFIVKNNLEKHLCK